MTNSQPFYSLQEDVADHEKWFEDFAAAVIKANDAAKATEGSGDEKKAEETKAGLKEAMGNLAACKRNLLINDISGAVSSFAEACKVSAETSAKLKEGSSFLIIHYTYLSA